MSISINRLSEAWFEFKGVRSTSYEAYMTQMPVREVPVRDIVLTKVAGRSGSVRQSDGSFVDISLRISFKLLNQAYRSAVDAWLTGSGKLRFSDEPEYEYDAVIETPPTRQAFHYQYDVQTYDVTFTCHPFRTLHTPAADITLTEDGTITNPGSAPALPRVKINGSGAFSVSIGAYTMTFHDVTDGGIIVDSELGDVLTYDGLLLANNNASGPLFQIVPGTNVVGWVEGGIDEDDQDVPLTGSVSSVVITPRWRYI